MTKSGKHCVKRRNCSFFFYHYVFKKPSAAEASESVYMREKVERVMFVNPLQLFFKTTSGMLSQQMLITYPCIY